MPRAELKPETADVRAQPRRPRDAATLVIVDRSGSEPRVLMGRRRDDVAFLPGKFVFPGGRVERSDGLQPISAHLNESDLAALCEKIRGRASRRRAQGFAVAAVRETFEETGLLVAAARPQTRSDMADWLHLRAGGLQPDLSALRFFARAITPPGRPRRYDTRFFLADAAHVTWRRAEGDGELSRIDWYPLSSVLDLDLPNITRLIHKDIVNAVIGSRGLGPPTEGIPFYFHQRGNYVRVLLSQPSSSA